MTFWVITGVVIIVGALGGLMNFFLSDSGSDNRFILPGRDSRVDRRIWKLGALGNIGFGAAAAFISWGLYCPFPPTSDQGFALTLSTVVGALLVGIGGSRVVTSELEKRTLSAAASTAAGAPANLDAAAKIATASSPTDALKAAEALKRAAANPKAQKAVAR